MSESFTPRFRAISIASMLAAMMVGGMGRSKPLRLTPTRLSRRRTPLPKPHKVGTPRLQMARGAGSINAKADMRQLCHANRWREAADMLEDHHRQCGEWAFPQGVADVWRSYQL